MAARTVLGRKSTPSPFQMPTDWIDIPGVTYSQGRYGPTAAGDLGVDFQVPEGIGKEQLDALLRGAAHSLPRYDNDPRSGSSKILDPGAPATLTRGSRGKGLLASGSLGLRSDILKFGQARGWYEDKSGRLSFKDVARLALTVGAGAVGIGALGGALTGGAASGALGGSAAAVPSSATLGASMAPTSIGTALSSSAAGVGGGMSFASQAGFGALGSTAGTAAAAGAVGKATASKAGMTAGLTTTEKITAGMAASQLVGATLAPKIPSPEPLGPIEATERTALDFETRQQQIQRTAVAAGAQRSENEADLLAMRSRRVKQRGPARQALIGY